MKPLSKILSVNLIFFIAMAYIESAIVVYLREIYYPHGFNFPIKLIQNHIAFIEIGREVSTIVILWFSTMLVYGKFKERFALFLFNFGVWDIFYYVWLRIFLDWPSGWFEWDILFLIPLPWTSPWPAPVLVSIGFIITAYLVLKHPQKFAPKIFNAMEWTLEILAAAIILWSFLWEAGTVLEGGIPKYYPWWIFFMGMALGLTVFIRRFIRGAAG